MFGFSVKLPVNEEDRLWVDDGFVRLERILGRERMLNAEAVLPEERFFPDVYEGSKQSVTTMAARIAAYLGVPSTAFSIEIFAENEEAWRQTIPERSEKTSDAAGLYFHEPEDGRHVVGVHAKHLKDPLLLAATIAHELVHVLLLGGGLLERGIGRHGTHDRSRDRVSGLRSVYVASFIPIQAMDGRKHAGLERAKNRLSAGKNSGLCAGPLLPREGRDQAALDASAANKHTGLLRHVCQVASP